MSRFPIFTDARRDGMTGLFYWNNQGTMHVTLVEINVHDDKVEQFIDVFRQNHLAH